MDECCDSDIDVSLETNRSSNSGLTQCDSNELSPFKHNTKFIDAKTRKQWDKKIRGFYHEINESKRFTGKMSKKDFLEIPIDSSFVGRIIGSGGSKIQDLQKESRARIRIFQDCRADSKASVRIFGPFKARQKAKQLIEKLTSDSGKLVTSETCNENHSFPDNNMNQDGQSQIDEWDLLNSEYEEVSKEKFAVLPPILKDFYHENSEISKMTPKDVAAFPASNNCISVIKVKSDDPRHVPNPVSNFEQAFEYYPELLQELKNQGFTAPSPIQCQAWPIIMKGYDMIGIAQTGSGKTIAFLFPALIHIVGQVTPREQRMGPSCLILAPTRELAQQIEIETKKYSYHNIKCVCIYGGGCYISQITLVTEGVDIVIATPGRLNDLVMNNIINLTGVTYLVLDEADRMLDLGFEPQIRKILSNIRPDRQTIMTSATWTSSVEELAVNYMTDPLRVNIGALDLAAVPSVKQEIIFAEDDDRLQLLKDFLVNMSPEDKVIVFVKRKLMADDISSDLILQGFECQFIHSNRRQCDRERALNDFRTGSVRILIATDIASRGLDINDITHIFNMYFPRNIEEYVHCIGRTGRAGRKGTAISIFTRKDWRHAEAMIKILKEAGQLIPEELCDMADRYAAWKRKVDAEHAEAVAKKRLRKGKVRAGSNYCLSPWF